MPLRTCFQEIARGELGFGKSPDQGSGGLKPPSAQLECDPVQSAPFPPETCSYPNPKPRDRERSPRSFLRLEHPDPKAELRHRTEITRGVNNYKIAVRS